MFREFYVLLFSIPDFLATFLQMEEIVPETLTGAKFNGGRNGKEI